MHLASSHVFGCIDFAFLDVRHWTACAWFLVYVGKFI